MGRELAERARQLCSEGVPVDAAIGELIHLADGNWFDLSAAYAVAVQDGGGVTPAAELLELVQYENEGRLRAAVNDPDRFPGKLIAGLTRAYRWGLHWAVVVFTLVVATFEADRALARWFMASYAMLFCAQLALIWYANKRREAPWEGHLQSQRAGVVLPLALRVARESIIIVRSDGDVDLTDRLHQVAVGDLDTQIARRRTAFVLREAARLLAASPLMPRDYCLARELIRRARLGHVQQGGGRRA